MAIVGHGETLKGSIVARQVERLQLGIELSLLPLQVDGRLPPPVAGWVLCGPGPLFQCPLWMGESGIRLQRLPDLARDQQSLASRKPHVLEGKVGLQEEGKGHRSHLQGL